MCIIVLDDREGTQERVDRAILKRCQEKNPDGMGIMYAHDGVLHSWRTMKDFRGLWNRYTTARDLKARVTLHFRIGTQGSLALDNCHPFHIGPTFAFMHNGTVGSLTPFLPDGISDSRFLCEEILKRAPGNFLQRPGWAAMFKALVGGDRFVFMDAQGRRSIINENHGTWDYQLDRKVWFSHRRDQTYIMTGKKWISTSSKKSDPHSCHRAESSKWYGDGNRESKDIDIVQKAKTREVKSKRIVLFDYGYMGHHLSDLGFHKIDPMGKLEGCQLEACTDPNGDEEDARPVAFNVTRQSAYVRGRVWTMAGSDTKEIDEMLKVLDGYYGVNASNPTYSTGAPYRRAEKKIRLGPNRIITAWAYIGNTSGGYNRRFGIVPFGEWDRWLLADKVDSDEIDSCPSCKSVSTTLYRRADGEHHRWCRNCCTDTRIIIN